MNETTVEDLTYAIKEVLDNDKCLTEGIVNQMQTTENLESSFILLSKELNYKEVTDFGKALMLSDVNDASIISYYIKYLLLEKVCISYKY